MIRLLSVPHCGTRFTIDVLKRAGLQPGVDFMQRHFTGDNDTYSDTDWTAVIPLRDKGEVIASWARRKRKDPPFDACWAQMEQFIKDSDDVYLLHVDDPVCRESELGAISKRIGIPLDADFSIKVGHGG